MRRPLPDMRMCKCTAKIVWDWEEQCFAAEYVWEFMSFCDNCWERFCENCWERLCERGSVRVIEVLGFKLLKVWELLMFCSLAEGVRVFYCYFSLNTSQNSQQESWVSETSLFVILIFTDTSQNRQNILLLFFEYVPKQSTKVMGLRDLFIGNLICTYTS